MATAKIVIPDSGFRELKRDQPQRRRLIISIEGEEKTGKNHFAFGAPGPIGYHSFDYGDEGVIEKFLATGKVIHKAEYRIEVPPGAGVQETSDKANPVWNSFNSNYTLGLTRFRTTIVDTGTDLWEIARMAYLGKLLQVMPHHYPPVNSAYKSLFRQAYSSPGNLILLHRLKDEWINKVDKQGKEVGIKTGTLLLAGYKDTPYETQVHLRTFKDSDGFGALVVECRQNPDLTGMELREEMCSFSGLGQMVYPDSKEEEWV